MALGAFSISLSVKDLAVSQAFYAKLGFETFAGEAEHGFLILKNGDSLIGLFKGMFDGNILTFNPGWDQTAQPVDDFEDVRDLHARLAADGVETSQEQGLDGDGVASFVCIDPDGNPILIDQHVPRPGTD